MSSLHCSSPLDFLSASEDAARDDVAYRKRSLSSPHSSGRSSGARASFDSSVSTMKTTTACCSQRPQPKRSRRQTELGPDDSDSDELLLPEGGWFAKCRGCGWMTSHEYAVSAAAVPCCRRCVGTFECLNGDKKDRMLQGLLYVHTAWTNAGL